MNKVNNVMKTKGKYVLLMALIVMLAAVGYINFALGNETTKSAAKQEPSEIEGAMSMDDLAVMSSKNYFYDYKANRENQRETEVAYLDSIINGELSDAENVKDAQNQKIQIVKNMESELTIEGLLMAVGFEDAIVTVQTGSVNVVLKKEQITKEEAAKVLEIVRKETGEPAQNIKVILQG